MVFLVVFFFSVFSKMVVAEAEHNFLSFFLYFEPPSSLNELTPNNYEFRRM